MYFFPPSHDELKRIHELFEGDLESSISHGAIRSIFTFKEQINFVDILFSKTINLPSDYAYICIVPVGVSDGKRYFEVILHSRQTTVPRFVVAKIAENDERFEDLKHLQPAIGRPLP